MATLLIVDDLLPNRLLIRQLCENIGHQTVEAADGVEALALVESCSPDLVLLDISMPNMDGFEAAQRIKSVAGDGYLPIIFVTSHSADSSLSKAIAAGGDDFISQPVNLNLLESKISAHLRIRELNQQLVSQNRKLESHNRRLLQEADLIGHFFDKALQRSYRNPDRIIHHSTPASAFNGDLVLAERGPDQQTYLLFGDFTGHGLQAAMGTLPVQQDFFELCQQGATVSEVVRQINQHLYLSMPESMFFAANLLVFDAEFESMQGWFGGMPPTWIISDSGELVTALESEHMPIGILDDREFDDDSITLPLEAGSRLYQFSDGAADRKGADGEMIGMEALHKLLTRTPVEKRLERLQALLNEGGSSDRQDDVSFVEIVLG